MSETDAESIARQRAHWSYRAVNESRGNSTPLGAVLLAVLGQNAKHPPGFGPSAVISPDGRLLSNFVDRGGRMTVGYDLGPVGVIRDRFRILADQINATDAEREDLFLAFRRWVSHDYRSILDPAQQVAADGGV